MNKGKKVCNENMRHISELNRYQPILSIMCHLGGLVLTEAETLELNATPKQEELSACHEIGKSLVVDDTFVNGLASRNENSVFLTRNLKRTGQERELQICNISEFGVRLIVGVNEVLDFSQGKLSLHNKYRSDMI